MLNTHSLDSLCLLASTAAGSAAGIDDDDATAADDGDVGSHALERIVNNIQWQKLPWIVFSLTGSVINLYRRK